MASAAMMSVEVPESFPKAFAPFTRVGREGWCVLCRQAIHSHVGPTGQWLGCTAPVDSVLASTPFLLVPAEQKSLTVLADWILSHAQDIARPPVRTGARVGDTGPARVRQVTERIRYRLDVVPTRVPRKLNGVQTDVLRVLSDRTGKDLGTTAIATLAHHPVETTRVALNQLWRRRVIRRSHKVQHG